MDNDPDNLETSKPDYYLFAGNITGDIGIPTMIHFILSGDDGWGGENVKIDYFHFPQSGFAVNLPWFPAWRNINDRKSFFNTGLDEATYTVWTTVEFQQKFLIDTDKSRDKDVTSLGPKGQVMYAKGAGISGGPIGNASVKLADETIVIDTRTTGQRVTTWTTSQSRSVSLGEIKEAIKAEGSTNGWSNTFSMSVTNKAEGTFSGVTASSEVSISNAFTASGSSNNSETNKSAGNITQSFNNTSKIAFEVLSGQVAFITMKNTATVPRYEPYAGAINRISEKISISSSVTSRYYSADCQTGKLRLINASDVAGQANSSVRNYNYGAALDESSESCYLQTGQTAFGSNFSANVPRC